MLEGILADVSADTFQLFLSDARANNFRTHIWPGYKANRPPERPPHYEELKEYLIVEWGARISFGMEADDSLGISQHAEYEFPIDFNIGDNPQLRRSASTVICSIDKDLQQIPGLHYNFVKKEFNEVSPQQGLITFYRQLLTGDDGDNIKSCYGFGLHGVGPVTALKILAKGGQDPESLFETVFNEYVRRDETRPIDEIVDNLLVAGRLLKIRTEEDEPLWGFPQSRLIQECFA